MRKTIPMLMVFLFSMMLIFFTPMVAMATDQCDVMGSTYTIELDGHGYTLTNFVDQISFSPAPQCGGLCTFINDQGASYSYEWSVVFGNLTVAGFPAFLTEHGLLLYAIPQDLYTTQIGKIIYKTPGKIPTLLFE